MKTFLSKTGLLSFSITSLPGRALRHTVSTKYVVGDARVCAGTNKHRCAGIVMDLAAQEGGR